MISKGCFESRVDGLRARIGEEDMVQSLGGELNETIGQFKGFRMPHLKRRRVVKFLDLPLHGFDNLGMRVAGVTAPETGRPVQYGAPIRRPIVHILG